MTWLKQCSRVMASPTVYRLWQAPFVKSKFAPILRHNDLARVRRVLDVGCGPGTNTAQFPTACDYLGLDIDEQYVAMARARHGRRFEVVDVTKYRPPGDEQFDFVLINSLLHHLDQHGVNHILQQVARVLAHDGHVHIVDLVIPAVPSIARYLARSDRGDFPRPLDEWKHIFEAHFESAVFEPFDVPTPRAPLWNMVYFKGAPRS